jgi:hypothetical protein
MNALKKLVYIASGEHKKPGEQRWDNVAATKRGVSHRVNEPWSSTKHRVSRVARLYGKKA